MEDLEKAIQGDMIVLTKAVDQWLATMRTLTGLSNQSLLSHSPDKSEKERKTLLALTIHSILLRLTFGDPKEFAKTMGFGE